jgi:uncharacterized protein (DUF1697 family)
MKVVAERKTVGKIIALLRGVNVGGKNPLPMKALAALFEKAGCENVVTYIQSGNVVCAAAREKDLATRIEAAIAKSFGLRVPVVLRTHAELKKIIASHPFASRDAEFLHVSFLSGRPAAADTAKLEPARFLPDELAVKGSEVYLYLPNGVGKSKLTNAYLDGRLGVVSTMRNWRTVRKLEELARAT